MKQKTCYLAAATLVLSACLGAPCRADELAQKGRAVFNTYQHAVVTVQLAVKNKISMSGMGGRSSETVQDATGTVVDPSGLTVLSLSATDPSQLFQNMMSGASEEESKLKVESELTDVKILLDDGTEIPAEVVLRDKDMDLAFIRPKAKPAAPMASIDLTKCGKAEILEQVLALNRLGSAAGRAYAASAERISAIVQKPRLFYVPETSATTTTLGAPAFNMEGKFLGIFVMRSLKGKSSSGMFGIQPENITGIILPADDIVKAIKQVPAAGVPAGAPAGEAKKEK